MESFLIEHPMETTYEHLSLALSYINHMSHTTHGHSTQSICHNISFPGMVKDTHVIVL